MLKIERKKKGKIKLRIFHPGGEDIPCPEWHVKCIQSSCLTH